MCGFILIQLINLIIYDQFLGFPLNVNRFKKTWVVDQSIKNKKSNASSLK